MFKIGDIVRPKLGFVGHNYCFQIIEIESSPFEKNLYRIQGIKQELDPTYGPASHQHNLIMKAEHVLWKEDELELTSDVKLRYEGTVVNIDDINDIAETNSEFLNQYAKKLIKECEVKINKLNDEINEEEEEMQILDLYEEKRVKALEEELLEAKAKVKEEDEIQNIILEMTSQVNTILKNQGRKTIYEFKPNLITLETEAKLDELEEKHHKQIEELRSTLREIRALFELTDDYNERIKILKNYDILDKKGKLNV